jgi:hypothetical protein
MNSMVSIRCLLTALLFFLAGKMFAQQTDFSEIISCNDCKTQEELDEFEKKMGSVVVLDFVKDGILPFFLLEGEKIYLRPSKGKLKHFVITKTGRMTATTHIWSSNDWYIIDWFEKRKKKEQQISRNLDTLTITSKDDLQAKYNEIYSLLNELLKNEPIECHKVNYENSLQKEYESLLRNNYLCKWEVYSKVKPTYVFSQYLKYYLLHFSSVSFSEKNEDYYLELYVKEYY